MAHHPGDTHVTVTPFWKGVIAGLGALFLWHHRGTVKAVAGRLMHPSTLFRGEFGDGPTGIVMPADADPTVAFRQMRRYAFAAMQDKSPIVGLTHASYALVALDILEEAVGRDRLAAAGCDAAKARAIITRLQDMHAKNLEACDGYMTQALAIERADGMQSSSAAFAGYDVYGAPTGA